MAKKYPKSEIIQNASAVVPEEAYVTWGDDLQSKQDAITKSAGSLEEFVGIHKAEAAGRRYSLDYSNLSPNTSGRPGLTRSDYYYFRPDEAPPKDLKLIIRRSEDIYQKVGLVKNVIDLMGDFAAQGVRIVHRNKRIERFYKQWFKKIRGKDRSERFLNNLYKTGNVVVSKQTAKLSLRVSDKLYQAIASPDIQVQDLDIIRTEKREIPWIYTFIDPVLVEVAAGSLSSFVNDSQKRYELSLPANLRRTIVTPKTESEKAVVSQLPLVIIEAAKNKTRYPLDPEKTSVFHYKKDDWQTWAYPMVYAIMDDITVLEKLKLADMAALDGAISNIRIFKLGSLEHKIAPTKAATAKLASILGNNVGGGTMDIVWGPDLELIESKTTVHNFLGESKYIPHLNSVYAGLGIPPTLTGTFGASGTTNNFISLKTLTQRLQYGRDVLVTFWEKEIEQVQKAMGFKYAAKIEFDRMDLSNEDTEKALLIQLADRNIVSDEVIQGRFGFDSEMEKTRLNRENKDRKTNRMVNKAGPWFDPQFSNSLKKIALQTGVVAPSQVGLELDKKKSGEKTAMELKIPPMGASPPTKLGNAPVSDALPKEAGDGRPKMAKDTQKRKTKTFKPRTGAKLTIWANAAQDKISDIINPVLLEFYNKKNLRSLSNIESQELEQVKTNILFSILPDSKINNDIIINAFNKTPQSQSTSAQYYSWLKILQSDLGRELSVDENRQAKATFYSMVYGDSITEE
jgi:hypothetical protein